VDNFRTNDLNGNDIYNKYRGGTYDITYW
jgi:hypothetical protein